MNSGDSFKAQQIRIKQLNLDIWTNGVWSFEVFLIVAISIRYLVDFYWARSEYRDIAQKYLSLSNA